MKEDTHGILLSILLNNIGEHDIGTHMEQIRITLA